MKKLKDIAIVSLLYISSIVAQEVIKKEDVNSNYLLAAITKGSSNEVKEILNKNPELINSKIKDEKTIQELIAEEIKFIEKYRYAMLLTDFCYVEKVMMPELKRLQDIDNHIMQKKQQKLRTENASLSTGKLEANTKNSDILLNDVLKK